MLMRRHYYLSPCLTLICAFFLSVYTLQADSVKSPSGESIDEYIYRSWGDLTRSILDKAAYKKDPKVNAPVGLYLPYGMRIPREVKKLQASRKLVVHFLPRPIHRLGDVNPSELPGGGLLYLPFPYVVPGGRFNEMYGWDSYFIIRGLLHDQCNMLAYDMIENLMFEVEYYGSVLNANRTYYLTRPQPPFLSSGVLAVYKNCHRNANQKWLERAYRIVKKDYSLWVHRPFLAGNTGLSRYYDVGCGPVPEVKADNNYYETVLNFIKAKPALVKGYYTTNACGMPCLSEDFYKGDRSMRASGFDVSFRFGPFGGKTHHFAPICLNSLLYKTEKDLEKMATWLHKPREAAYWNQAAEKRKAAINQYLWDPEAGLFFDYNFKEKKRSSYRYASTFYPLWVRLATPAQALSLVRHLSCFEREGGVMMSEQKTGVQWDKPYGWPPIQLLITEGLLHYGYVQQAKRIASKFDHTIDENFERTGAIFEKYNMETKDSHFKPKVGYQENVIGFGWTNGTYRVLQDMLERKADAVPSQ